MLNRFDHYLTKFYVWIICLVIAVPVAFAVLQQLEHHESGFTADTEWDTLGEIETVVSENIITSTEMAAAGYLTGNETITLSGDVSGSGATAITTAIGADKVTEAMLKAVDAAVDEYLLTYESTTGDFEWHQPSELITAGTLIAWTGTTLNVTEAQTLAAVLALGADANDVNITSLAKLEFFDAAIYVDGSADGVLDVEADTTLNLGTTATTTNVGKAGSNVIVGGTGPDSLFEVDGPEGLAIQTVTGNTTLDNTHSTLLVNASGNVTITLATAASCYNNTDGIGRIYEIKKIDADADTVTVDGNGSETIDGSTTAVITTQYESITIQSSGVGWFIL